MNIYNICYFLKNKSFDFKNKKLYLKIFNRNLKISKILLNLNFAIYNGKFFIPINIDESKINNRLGAFAFSKSILLKEKKKKYKKKIKK